MEAAEDVGLLIKPGDAVESVGDAVKEKLGETSGLVLDVGRRVDTDCFCDVTGDVVVPVEVGGDD